MARHRRWVVALLLGAAVVAGLASLAPQQPVLDPVVVAAHDLAAGTVLTAGDLAVVAEPPSARPDGALADPSPLPGRSLAAPMRRGEPFTDVRLLGPALLVGSTGLVAYPVRIADAAATALLRPGDLVDVLAAAQSGDVTGPAGSSVVTGQVVADAVRVLAVPSVGDGSGTSAGFAQPDGALVVLAVTPSAALALAGASASARLSVSIRRSDDTS